MNRAGRLGLFRRLLSIALLAASVVGCAPPASEGDFDSPNPAARLYAIHRAGETDDQRSLNKLIEQLASDDPAVRLYAIVALEKISDRRDALSRMLATINTAPPASPGHDQAVARFKAMARQAGFDEQAADRAVAAVTDPDPAAPSVASLVRRVARLGYSPYAPPYHREPAIERWADWARQRGSADTMAADGDEQPAAATGATAEPRAGAGL
mgnify:FL=1